MMRSVNGARNRALLVIFGLASLAMCAWMVASSLNVAERFPWSAPYMAGTEQSVDDLLEHAGHVGDGIIIVLAVLMVLVGFFWLMAQIPRKPVSTDYRFHTSVAGTNQGARVTVENSALVRALGARVKELDGVWGADVVCMGAARQPMVRARIDVRPDADVPWVIGQVRARLNADIATCLGNRPREVDLIVSVDAHAGKRQDVLA